MRTYTRVLLLGLLLFLPVIAGAQDTSYLADTLVDTIADTAIAVVNGNGVPFWITLFTLISPALVAKLTEYGTQGVKRIGTWSAVAPGWTKQGLALGISLALSFLSVKLNVPALANGIEALSSSENVAAVINALIAWVLSMTFYNSKKLSAVAPTAKTVEGGGYPIRDSRSL